MIANQQVINYNVGRKAESFYIDRCDIIRENEILLNYGGHLHSVSTNIFDRVEPGDCIATAARYIQAYHAEKIAHSRPRLNYGFDDRFCGALIPRAGDDLLQLPFRSFDENIITMCGGCWDLIDKPPF